VDSSGSGRRPVGAPYEHGNEPSGSVKFTKIYCASEQLSASREGFNPLELLFGYLVS
jgi:hypothetical protein